MPTTIAPSATSSRSTAAGDPEAAPVTRMPCRSCAELTVIKMPDATGIRGPPVEFVRGSGTVVATQHPE